jgi:hypothetical protein
VSETALDRIADALFVIAGVLQKVEPLLEAMADPEPDESITEEPVLVGSE